MGAQAQTHDILQSQDARAQQSQQAPTQILLNSTNAEQRWDGKSAILRYLEPIISTFKSVVSPITNALYGAMPTVRNLNSDVSTATNVEPDLDYEVKKPKEFLVPQPRLIKAQRKNFRKTGTRPKKHAELKIDLDRLKHNKDLYDYMKTKKYKHNYPSTYFYPRVKYIVQPVPYHLKPNNSRLIPYRNIHTTTDTPTTKNDLSFVDSDWQPVIVFNNTKLQNETRAEVKRKGKKGLGRKAMRRFFRRKSNLKRRKRIKRDLADLNTKSSNEHVERGFFDIISVFFTSDPINNLLDKFNDYGKNYLREQLKSSRGESPYYTTVYNIFLTGIDIVEGILGVGEEMHDHYIREVNSGKRINKNKYKTKKNRYSNCSKSNNNNTNSVTTEESKEQVTSPDSVRV